MFSLCAWMCVCVRIWTANVSAARTDSGWIMDVDVISKIAHAHAVRLIWYDIWKINISSSSSLFIYYILGMWFRGVQASIFQYNMDGGEPSFKWSNAWNWIHSIKQIINLFICTMSIHEFSFATWFSCVCIENLSLCCHSHRFEVNLLVVKNNALSPKSWTNYNCHGWRREKTAMLFSA